ncbi:hypothetical protein EDB89DRAFT_2064950 [Lactarius sanguifluus]|nr:hypothetical protein EDB89DRAFT_2064950 [Lactarius sanguifluus]
MTAPPAKEKNAESLPKEATLKTSTATRVAISSRPAANSVEVCKNQKKIEKRNKAKALREATSRAASSEPDEPSPTPAPPSTVLAEEAPQSATRTQENLDVFLNTDGPPPNL